MYCHKKSKLTIALKEFERTGSISATIQNLGCPSPAPPIPMVRTPKSRIEKLAWILRANGK